MSKRVFSDRKGRNYYVPCGYEDLKTLYYCDGGILHDNWGNTVELEWGVPVQCPMCRGTGVARLEDVLEDMELLRSPGFIPAMLRIAEAIENTDMEYFLSKVRKSSSLI